MGGRWEGGGQGGGREGGGRCRTGVSRGGSSLATRRKSRSLGESIPAHEVRSGPEVAKCSASSCTSTAPPRAAMSIAASWADAPEAMEQGGMAASGPPASCLSWSKRACSERAWPSWWFCIRPRASPRHFAMSSTPTTPAAPTTGRWRKRFSIMVHRAFSAVEAAATTCGFRVITVSTVTVSGSRPAATTFLITSVSVRMPCTFHSPSLPTRSHTSAASELAACMRFAASVTDMPASSVTAGRGRISATVREGRTGEEPPRTAPRGTAPGVVDRTVSASRSQFGSAAAASMICLGKVLR